MIEVANLQKRFGDVEAVAGLSFSAAPGEVTGFLGQNGAGKTTTMRMLSTLIRPTAGTATVAGYDVVADPEGVRRSIGLLTEEPGLYDRMTPREQLRFFAAVNGMPVAAADARIDELAALLDFEVFVERKAGELSKGNRQKVAVARALLHDPPVLLLDEPTAGLDVVAADAMEAFLLSDAVRDKTILLSSHISEQIARLCRTIVVVSEGRLVAAGAAGDVVAATGAADLREALIDLMRAPARGGVR